MSKDIKEFKINHKNWGSSVDYLRGNDSFLRNWSTNKKCCLGFLATACGVGYKHITNVCYLSALSKENKDKIPDFIFTELNNFKTIEDKLIDINDDLELTVKEKEEQITKIFADNGVKVIFTG